VDGMHVVNAVADAFADCRMSALHQAALIGNTDVMRLLLDHGAAVDIADSKSKSLFRQL